MSAESVATCMSALGAFYLDAFARSAVSPKSGDEARIITAACAALMHDGIEIAERTGKSPALDLVELAARASDMVCRACYGHGITHPDTLCARCGGTGLNPGGVQ